jgi:hypothetical protein
MSQVLDPELAKETPFYQAVRLLKETNGFLSLASVVSVPTKACHKAAISRMGECHGPRRVPCFRGASCLDGAQKRWKAAKACHPDIESTKLSPSLKRKVMPHDYLQTDLPFLCFATEGHQTRAGREGR